MVQSEEIRSAFVKRLKQALAKAGIAEWGAGSRLAEITKKTPKAASKWLNGETMPGRASMQAIAEELHVRIQWLQYGEGEIETLQSAETARIAQAVPPTPSAPAHPEQGEPGVAPPEGLLTIAGLLDQLRLSPDGIPDPHLKAALINLLTQYQEDPNRGAEIASAILLLTKKD